MKRRDPSRDVDYYSLHHNGAPSRYFRRVCNKRARRIARREIEHALLD